MDAPAPRRHQWAEYAALAAAVVPAVVMVVRAAAARWVPLFDAAYFTVRSRDVATEHNPVVGAWSMGSREVGVWINNLGPLQLDLLAPFTKLDPYWGTALGVAATNVAAIVGVWFVARRMFGSIGVIGAMAATVLIELNEGSLMLIEARQQLALVLPMWCLLWLAAAAWHGDRWVVPWLVFTASLVLQTHFTYAYQTVAVALSGALALVVQHRRRWRSLVPSAGTAALVAAACWAMPLWDQVAGSGNLGRVLGESGGSDRSVGTSKGLRILAESVFVPPFFSPGSMGDLLRSGPRPSTAYSVVALLVWAGLLATTVVTARRRRSPIAALAAVALVALIASGYAVTKIPPTEQFGIIAQNYYWAWPVGIFAGTALLAGATRAMLGQFNASTVGDRSVVVGWAFAGLVLVGAVPLLTPTDLLPETDHEWSVARRQARPLLDQFGDALDELALDGPVLVDLGSVRHVRYTMLTEFQVRGIDFRFAPGSTDLSRFGRARCDIGTATTFITLRGGRDAVRLDVPGTLLAAVPGLTDSQNERTERLASRFGDALRDGTVTVDESLLETNGDIPRRLRQVIGTPGMPARGLAEFLDNYSSFDVVVVPDRLRDELDDWRQLEYDADANRMAIYLQRIPGNRFNRCGAVDPGDTFLETTQPA